MKLLKNFTWKDLEEIEESLDREEEKEKVYITLPKVPKVSLKNYKQIAHQIREAITESGISPDTWEDLLNYFDLKLRKKGKYAETTLDKALETYLRKRLGWKITDVWREIIEAYENITNKPLIPPPEVQNILLQELEIQGLMKLPNINVIVVEKPVKHSSSSRAKSVKQRTQKLKVKPSDFKKLIEELKAKSKKLYIFYVKDGKKIVGVLIFYEKP